jgi:hypothetical protein
MKPIVSKIALTPKARPSVAGKGLHPDVASAIQLLQDQVQALMTHASQVKSAGYLTSVEAEKKYSPKVMAKELGAYGSAPLTISGSLILPRP